MTRNIHLVQLGVGLIGQAVIEQVLDGRDRWRAAYGIDVTYRALVDSSTAVACGDPEGYSERTLRRTVETRRAGGKVLDVALELGLTPRDAGEALIRTMQHGPTIVLDTAAGSGSTTFDAVGVSAGAGIVLSNKAPLALPAADRHGAALWGATGLDGRVRYETTCGAGLPVISTLQSLLATGDIVIEINGTVSGTLGAIFSSVAAGASFSEAVLAAKEAGYTEPDPRDDLSGLDVARKALILARTMGRTADLADVQVESLVPAHLRDCSIDEFMAGVSALDGEMAERAAAAKRDGMSLKYVASVPADGPIAVGVKAVPTSTVLGALQGPENIVSFRTARYDAYPLTVSGPGAGAAVTAAGVVADMLALATGRFGG